MFDEERGPSGATLSAAVSSTNPSSAPVATAAAVPGGVGHNETEVPGVDKSTKTRQEPQRQEPQPQQPPGADDAGVDLDFDVFPSSTAASAGGASITNPPAVSSSSLSSSSSSSSSASSVGQKQQQPSPASHESDQKKGNDEGLGRKMKMVMMFHPDWLHSHSSNKKS